MTDKAKVHASSRGPAASEVNVVFSADRNFLPHFATSLASLLASRRDPRPLNVYLLTDDDFTAEDQKRIESLGSIKPFAFHSIRVDASMYSGIKTTVGITVATYNRLFMDALLPSHVGRVLYLDSDLIVLGDIADIYDLSMDGLLFRGVEDSTGIYWKSRFAQPEDSRHINAGVMLCNVELMRSIGFDESIRKYLDVHRYRIVLGDQQIINEAFHDRIGPLPLRWNVHGSLFDPAWVQSKVGVDNSYSLAEATAAASDPAIIHYTYKRKPWMSLEHPRAQQWHHYNKMTPYVVGMPAASPTSPEAADEEDGSLRSQVARFARRGMGYLRSLELLRHTRLEVEALSRRVRVTPEKDALGAASRVREALLWSMLRERGEARRHQPFNAAEFVKALPADSSVLCNTLPRDLDAGFNEYIKTVLRTSNISRGNVSDCLFAIITAQRIHLPEFWLCVNTACFYDLPLLFIEMNFFAAFAAYFDKDVKSAERRCFGFIIDDMGSYFDARQPSRMETILNDDAFSLSAEQTQRARALIASINTRRFTKYNKYVSAKPLKRGIEKGAIVVIDQKMGDASIEFARAETRSFQRMLSTAIAENPGRTIYLKAHPDNLHRDASGTTLLHPRVKLIADEVSAPDLVDLASKVYVVSSQVGFEALLRGKQVVVFGLPFYAGWGLTDDRVPVPRRRQRRSIEDLFHVSCIQLSVYVDPTTARLIEMEEMLDLIDGMRKRFPHVPRPRKAPAAGEAAVASGLEDAD
jgi:lipopolysaccharide biosynthesis glycosyltransferase